MAKRHHSHNQTHDHFVVPRPSTRGVVTLVPHGVAERFIVERHDVDRFAAIELGADDDGCVEIDASALAVTYLSSRCRAAAP